MPTLRDLITRSQAPPIALDSPPPLSGMVAPEPMQAAPTLTDMIAPPQAPAPPSANDARIMQDKGTLANVQNKLANPYGSANNHPGIIGNILHGLSVAGQVAGGVVAPEILPFISGTRANLNAQKTEATNDLNAAESTKSTELGQAQQQAQTTLTQAQPGILQAKIQQKQDLADAANQQKAAAHGQMYTRDADGVVSIQDDPNSEIFQRNQIKEQLLDAQVKSTGAQQDLRTAEAEYDKAKGDPTSPIFRQKAQQLAIAQQNANAAVTRAQAYMGNYLQHTRNVDLSGNVLPGAPQIANDDGSLTTVGSTNAGQAVKANANAAQFGDVHGALDSVEQAAKVLVGSGGTLNDPSVIAALTHAQGPHGWITGSINNYLKSENSASLSPQQRDYVLAINAAHENVQALRKAAGGTATDSSVAKLDALIPGAQTPDLPYLLGQTKQIRATADRLGKGVTTVSGGLTVPRNVTSTPPSGPKAGDIEGGYKFKGGDPSKAANWEKQ